MMGDLGGVSPKSREPMKMKSVCGLWYAYQSYHMPIHGVFIVLTSQQRHLETWSQFNGWKGGIHDSKTIQ
jgi:hypothetical protein